MEERVKYLAFLGIPKAKTKKKMKVYVIIGETEEVFQPSIGDNFQSSFRKEIIAIYRNESEAKKFIDSNRLKKPKKQNFCGTKCYKTGHYSMEIEEHYVTR